jgi:hypothetical protein
MRTPLDSGSNGKTANQLLGEDYLYEAIRAKVQYRVSGGESGLMRFMSCR